MRKFLFVVLFLCIPSPVFATTYYTAKLCSGGAAPPNCSDANDGLTAATAELTLIAGYAHLTAGDTLIVGAGTFYERLRPNTNGTSGSRITITGTRGGLGEYLTIIDGSEILNTWVAAPEIGSNVWKVTTPTWAGPVTSQTNEPCSLNADGLAVSQINWWWTDSGGGLPSDYGTWQSAMTNVSTDSTFEGTDALFANDSGTTYLHFRDNSNPNSKTIRVAPWSYRCQPRDTPDFGTFFFNGTNYNTIKNFEIQGSSSMVVDYGGTGNIIEDNYIHDGDHKVVLWGSANSIVRNNTIFWNSWGHTTYHPESWTPYEGSVPSERQYIDSMYYVNKYVTGNYDQYAVAVYAFNTAGATISSNEMYYLNNCVAIVGTSSSDSTISNNNCHDTFGSAIYWGADDTNGVTGTLTIANNLLNDTNTPIRTNFSERQTSALTVYIYGNRIYLPPDIGSHHYFTVETPATSNVIMRIYHNTFIGGVEGYTQGNGNAARFPNLLQINNIIQLTRTTGPIYTTFTDSGFCSQSTSMKAWDYNWTFGYEEAGCAWLGIHNIEANAKIFLDASFPASWIATGSAVEAGIDVSQMFVVNGVTYQPLPGFNPGYFSGAAPDVGVILDSTPITSPILEDFESYTLAANMEGLSGGTGFIIPWDESAGSTTIETATCLTSKTAQTSNTNYTYAKRSFTSKTGTFTIQVKICLSIDNPNSNTGIVLVDNFGTQQIWATFSGANLLFNGATEEILVAGFIADTPYPLRFNFDTVNHPNQVRIAIGDGAYSAWFTTVDTFAAIEGIAIFNSATNAHILEVDDINDSEGPPTLPPAPVNPIGIRMKIRMR